MATQQPSTSLGPQTFGDHNKGTVIHITRCSHWEFQWLGAISPINDTPPKFNSSPLKNDGWKITFLLGWLIFRGELLNFQGVLIEARNPWNWQGWNLALQVFGYSTQPAKSKIGLAKWHLSFESMEFLRLQVDFFEKSTIPILGIFGNMHLQEIHDSWEFLNVFDL